MVIGDTFVCASLSQLRPCLKMCEHTPTHLHSWWCVGHHLCHQMEIRLITWSDGSNRPKTGNCTSTTTAQRVRTYTQHVRTPHTHHTWLSTAHPFLCPAELKIPVRIAAIGVGDQEEDTKPTKPDPEGADKGPCCPCPKSVEDLEAEAADASYRKVFENFLHNSIFTPR